MRAMVMLAAFLATTATATALTGCGGDGDSKEAAPSGQALETFEVVETEFELSPSTFTIDEPGTYAFHVVNRGAVEHSLEIEGEGIEVELEDNLAAGASATLTATLKPGTYEMYCPVGNHKDLGMKGTISLGGNAPPPTTTETESNEGSRGY